MDTPEKTREAGTRRTRWALPTLALAVLLLSAALGGGTMALWKGAGEPAPTTIITGNLDVTAKSAQWADASADVKGRAIDPATFLVRRGDTVTMTQAFTTELAGDNLAARIAVDWAEPASLPAGVTGTYEILTARGQRLGEPAPLGTATTLSKAGEILVADDAGRRDEFAVRITLDFAGLADRFGEKSSAQLTDLGRFAFSLDQVREAGGTR